MKLNSKAVKALGLGVVVSFILGVLFAASEQNKTEILIVDNKDDTRIGPMILIANDNTVNSESGRLSTTISGNTDNDYIKLKVGLENKFEAIDCEGTPTGKRHISKIVITLNQESNADFDNTFSGKSTYGNTPPADIVYNSQENVDGSLDKDGNYMSTCTKCDPHKITFKINMNTPSELLNLKMKKKKKDTRIDVYLSDTGNKDLRVGFLRIANWLTSLL